MANEKRLIDANKLKTKAIADPDSGEGIVYVQDIDEAPTVKAVPLADIYRVIAGHSNYHGDKILSALTCIAEGKEVKPVKPLPTVEVVHGRWKFLNDYQSRCSECHEVMWVDNGNEPNYCPNCGAKMDGDGNA